MVCRRSCMGGQNETAPGAPAQPLDIPLSSPMVAKQVGTNVPEQVRCPVVNRSCLPWSSQGWICQRPCIYSTSSIARAHPAGPFNHGGWWQQYVRFVADWQCKVMQSCIASERCCVQRTEKHTPVAKLEAATLK